MKNILMSLLIGFSSILAAEESYSVSGIVDNQSADASIITVDSVDYLIDYETLIHKSLVRPGEKAPIFPVGTLLGFNIDYSANPPRITEVWVLDN